MTSIILKCHFCADLLPIYFQNQKKWNKKINLLPLKWKKHSYTEISTHMLWNLKYERSLLMSHTTKAINNNITYLNNRFYIIELFFFFLKHLSSAQVLTHAYETFCFLCSDDLYVLFSYINLWFVIYNLLHLIWIANDRTYFSLNFFWRYMKCVAMNNVYLVNLLNKFNIVKLHYVNLFFF